MKKSEFLNIFKESFDELETNVALESNFREIEEWTSMQALIFIAHVDDTLNIVLSADDIRLSKTVEDLYEKAIAKT